MTKRKPSESDRVTADRKAPRQPAGGGSFLRLPDGTLTPETAAAVPTAQGEE